MADSTVRLMFLGNATSAVKAAGSVEKSMGGLSKAAGFAGKALSVGVLGGLALATKAAIDFDKSMRDVNSIAKLSESQFKSLEKQVLSMAKTTAQTPKTLADGLYDIVSSGFKAGDAMKVLHASAIAATAGLTDTGTSAKAVVSVLNAYHMSADQAAHVSDILFQTVDRGVLNFEELASQIGDVLPIAAQLGVPLEDVGAALATITLHGVSAAEAATQLKQVYTSILKPSEDLTTQIKKMGFESGEAAIKTLGLEGFMTKLTVAAHGSGAAFADWFPNVRAMNGALGLTGKNIKTLHENIVAMKDAQGSASAAFKEQSKSIAVQWQQVKASVTAAAIPIGELLFPALRKAMEGVGQLGETISSHQVEIKSMFTSVGTTAQGLGGSLEKVTSLAGGTTNALLAVGGGLAAIKGGAALEGLIGGLGRMGPVGILAAGAIAAVAMQFVYGAQQAGFYANAIDNVNQALNRQQAAENAAATSARNSVNLKNAIRTINLQIEGGEKLLARSIDETGRKSLETRTIQQSLRNLRAQLKQATQDLTTSEKQHAKSLDDVAAAHKKAAGALTQTRIKMDQLLKLPSTFGAKESSAVNTYATAVGNWGVKSGASAARVKALKTATKELFDELGHLPKLPEIKLRANFDALSPRIAKQTGEGAGRNIYQGMEPQIEKAKTKVGEITNVKIKPLNLKVDHSSADQARKALDGINEVDLKDKSFTVTQTNVTNNIINTRRTTTRQNRAHGGVITAATGTVVPGFGSGDIVPAMLTPGEVVFNKAQQGKIADKLGVANNPHAIFAEGFARGGVVQYFAAGGITSPGPGGKRTQPPKVRVGALKSGKSYPRPQGESGKTVTGKPYEIMRPVYDIRRTIDQKYTEFDQKQRGFDQSEEEFLKEVTDANGDTYEVLDQAALDKRLAELDELIRLRNEILYLIQREQQLLEEAIKALKLEIVKLQNDLAYQQTRMKNARDEVKMLTATKKAQSKIGAGGRPGRESGGQNPAELQKLINYWEAEEKKAGAQITKDRAEIKSYRSAVTTGQGMRQPLRNEVVDVGLDIKDLQIERDADAETKAAGQTGEGGGGGGDGGGGDSGAGATGPTEEEQRLLAIIGQLRLALGIEAAQLGVLGGAPEGVKASPLAKDIIHQKRRQHLTGPHGFAVGGMVPGGHGAPRLILAHGGEMVLNAGQQARLGGSNALARQFGFQRFAMGGVVDDGTTAAVSVGRSAFGHGGAGPTITFIQHFDPAMEWLKDYVRTSAISASGEISRHIGERANERRRAGRF